MKRGNWLCMGCLGFSLLVAGCDSKPARVEQPPYDPSAIAKGAMEAYDANGDGGVSGEELAKAGCLRDHPDLGVAVIDKNSDGKVTADEVQARVEAWIERKTGVKSFQVQVMKDGKPLENASVKLVPEPFMGGSVPPASGTSGPGGIAILGIADSELDSDLSGGKYVKPGYYKIEITHPSEQIAAKYNSETTLGQEISDEAIGSANFIYDVK